MNSIRQQLGTKVLTEQITERVAVAKAATEQLPIYQMGDSDASAEFRAVSRELLQRIGVTR